MRILLFLFILVPIVEIFVLIQVGQVIGGLPTIAMVVLTAVVGVALLRRQGRAALLRARSKLNEGALPAREMIEGIFLAVGGALLLTPGFITDFLGFCCLLPGVRQVLIGWGLKHLTGASVVAYRAGGFGEHLSSGGHGGKASNSGDTIEGEYKKEK